MTDRAAIAAGYYGGGGFGGIGLIVLIIVLVLAVAVSGEQRRRNAWPGRTAERAVTSVGFVFPAYARPIGRSHQPRNTAHDPHRPRRPPAAPDAAAAEARDARAG
jgi:hypothetical protein